jgi:hypothetical protein
MLSVEAAVTRYLEERGVYRLGTDPSQFPPEGPPKREQAAQHLLENRLDDWDPGAAPPAEYRAALEEELRRIAFPEERDDCIE